jgi:Ca-activated chloride channel homolog
MKITPDDPKLTAYALGELDKAERAIIEAELEKSFTCQREVEDIRETADLLKKNLAAEELPDLTFAQQRKIENQLRRSEKSPGNWWNRQWFPHLRLIEVLAVLSLVAIIAALLLPSLAVTKRKSIHAGELAKLKQQPIGAQMMKEKPAASLDLPQPASPAPTVTPPPASVLEPQSSAYVGTINLGTDVSVESGRIQNQVVTLNAGYNLSVKDLRLGDERFSDKNRYVYSSGGTATYPHLVENDFLTALSHPLSTFSIDVDTASYANIRRFLNEGRMPPPEAVRIEEMINYFHYDYPQPRGEDPFSANIEIAGCPWNTEHRLVRIGLKGREIAQDKRPPSNFVFLIDVSGSMQPPERLPLIKQALRQLVKKMTENDRVAIVVYASEAGIKLPSTSCSQKEKILEAIDELGAGGSTAGEAGIQGAYEVAQDNFIKGGVNRVILCTDGDFNVGITDPGSLVRIIEEKAKSGVFLTTLGVGTDNYKDALMQKLADKGNGNYYYLDSLEEAQKVLIEQMNGTLVTIAKDVKIQVEFNPGQVAAYRLIGYEKRMLKKEDFNNDKKDAGEIGAGHTVTALYEVVPAGKEVPAPKVDDLKYQQPAGEKPVRYVVTNSKELLTLKLRYKQPDGNTSRLLTFPVMDNGKGFERASTDFKFAASVAEFGMLLRDSEYQGNSSYGNVLELAQSAKGSDTEGYRSEFITLVRKARNLAH